MSEARDKYLKCKVLTSTKRTDERMKQNERAQTKEASSKKVWVMSLFLANSKKCGLYS